jgi:hypothetical protein
MLSKKYNLMRRSKLVIEFGKQVQNLRTIAGIFIDKMVSEPACD